ncbi:hypothetical protein ACOBQJ_15820 [Pelotomaculum propionicicum]|uniref:hypothetical protein n=1 Tax=Pelotomaculum propionicicum TaxID=258475 RepID=UPI003B77A746
MIKDLIIALSLANLCMIRGWSYVSFTLSPSSHYYMKYPSTVNHFTAVIIMILLLAALFFVAITLARRSKYPALMTAARVAFLLTLTIPVNGILSNYKISVQNNLYLVLIALVLLELLLVLKIYKKNPSRKLYFDIFSFLNKALLIMSAFLLFNIFQTAWQLARMDPSVFSDKASAPLMSGELSHPRVLLLIFDEMSQGMVFDSRPAGVELTEFDRFKNQALYANNAYPPGGETDISLPSIVTGRMVSEFKPIKPNELMITFEGESRQSGWSTIPNIFSKVHEMSLNTSVVGWYHPYGRLFGGIVTSCSWYPYGPFRQMSLAESFAVQVENLVDIIPFGKRLRLSNNIFASDILIQQGRYNNYLDIMEDTKEAVCNPDYGLILAHWPVPHPPGIYDRTKNAFRLEGGSYLDNLVLADQTLGELRRVMEDAGTWENTNVIITSDHWWRSDMWSSKLLWTEEDELASLTGEKDHRVPFIIKMAGQNDLLNYNQKFNTVVIHDLILAILKNEFSRPEEVVNWLNNNVTSFRIPDYSSKKQN